MTTGEIDREWMVALCGRDRSQGALRLANWLADHAARGRWSLRGVHVITRDAAVVRDHPELMESARRKIRHEIAELVTEAGAGQSLGEIELIEAESPEDGLREVVRSEGVQGLVIGRPVGADEPALVRLGRTARWLLRECEVPVLVAGRDLDPALLEAGPVVVAVALTDRDARATTWARGVAEALGRPLRLVYVAHVPEGSAIDDMAPEPSGRRLDAIRERAELALAQWQSDHGLQGVPADVVLGTQLAERILEHAADVDACMLVCGTRQLDMHAPRPETGLSTELAASSRWPVAVVPSIPRVLRPQLDSSTQAGTGADGRSPSMPTMERAHGVTGRPTGKGAPRPLPIGPFAHGLIPWA